MIDSFAPKKVLAVAAHADDNDFCFGGTFAKWIKQGCEVHYLIVSDGQRGTSNTDIPAEQLIETRQSEQQVAADILGVRQVTNLGYEDGRIESTFELKMDITKAIREIRPDTVASFDPTFFYSTQYNYPNHADHRNVGQAVFDAVYPLARDESAFEELTNLETHKVSSLMLYNLNDENVFIDISPTLDKKAKALKAHQSQFGDGSDIEKAARDFASKTGEKAGCQKAEGFVLLKLS